MVNSFMQNFLDAEADAISLSEFIYKPASFMVERRLAPAINTLQYYLDYLAGLELVYSQQSGFVDVNGVQTKTVTQAVNDALDTASVENGLSDQLVVVTPQLDGAISRTQADKNSESITVKDFGAISDGVYHPLSERYATLQLAQEVYSFASALTDSIDGCALQAFFNYCHANLVERADATIKGYINKSIDFLGFGHATNTIYGNIDLVTDEPLDYMLWMTGQRFQYMGTIKLRGAVSDIPKNRVTRQGLILGSPVTPAVGYMTNSYIAAVDCSYFLDSAVNWSDYCHFSEIGLLRSTNIGSAGEHTASFSAVSTIGGDVNQASILTVDDLPPVGVKNGYYLLSVNNQCYRVVSVDRAGSTVRIYPQLPVGITSGEVKYIYGNGLYTVGADSSCKRVSQCQHILTGIGLNIQTLFGLSVGNLTTEFNGAGLLISGISDVNIGSIIESAYFEENQYDIVGGAFPTNNNISILQTASLDLAKCVALYKYRIYTGELIGGNLLGGTINISGKTYSGVNGFDPDITQPRVINFKNVYNSNTIQLTYDFVALDKFYNPEIIYVLSGVDNPRLNGDIVFLPPSGASINGQSSFTVYKDDYEGSAVVVIRVLNSAYVSASIVTPKIARKNNTANRPLSPSTGQMYLDTALAANGKPVWWNGSSWVDYMGVLV